MPDTRLPRFTPEQLEVRRKWREALRSGKYAQGPGALRDSSNRFCCLGVLCDVVEPSGWNGEANGFACLTSHRGNAALPKDHVQVAAGIADPWTYAVLNDEEGKSFAEIADFIEAEEANA